jgi:NADH:ubiquinone oxidoreductase subunit 5 (subunit L)/multisubunit Na+/H+ antiporter MnhA subunit
MPPFSGFMAKTQVVLAAADARSWVAMGIATAVGLLTMAYMTAMVQRVFRGQPHSSELVLEEIHEVPASMRWAMGMLAAAILALGLRPQMLDPLLDLVARM